MILAGILCLILWLIFGFWLLLLAAVVLILLGLCAWFVPFGPAGARRTHRWY